MKLFKIPKEYTNIKIVPIIGVCAIQQFIFTYAIICNITDTGYEYRYCFHTKEEAIRSLKRWKGKGLPSGNWIRRKPDNYNNPNYVNYANSENKHLLKKRKLVRRIMASLLPNKDYKFYSFIDNELKIKDRFTNKICSLEWISYEVIFTEWGVNIGNYFISYHPDSIDARKPMNHPMIQKLIDESNTSPRF